WAYGSALVAAGANVVLALEGIRRFATMPATRIDIAGQEQEPLEGAAAFKRLSWIANPGGVFGASMVIHLLPDLAVRIGISPDGLGRLLACWRAVIIATYLLMHFAAFWHYRLKVSLAAQALGACGLVAISQAETAATLLIGLALLGQLVGYNYFSGLYYS